MGVQIDPGDIICFWEAIYSTIAVVRTIRIGLEVCPGLLLPFLAHRDAVSRLVCLADVYEQDNAITILRLEGN